MSIGFVLSGGGARGIAHLGILKALGEMGIRPTKIAGSSAGAIAGALVAAGKQPDEILDILQTTNLLRYLRPALSRLGLLKMDRAEDLLLKFFPENSFEALGIPLFVAATDLQDGCSVIFDSGPLVRPLMATCSLPGLFEPVLYQKRYFVDGGVLNNMPLGPLEPCCDLLIGSHVNPYGATDRPLNSMRSVLERSLSLAINKSSRQHFERYHLLFEPPALRNYTVFDIKKARELYRVGYLHAQGREAEIRRVVEERLNQPVRAAEVA